MYYFFNIHTAPVKMVYTDDLCLNMTIWSSPNYIIQTIEINGIHFEYDK